MLIKYDSLTFAEKVVADAAIREIFFRSATKTFSTPEERQTFYTNWTDYYFTAVPGWIYLYASEKQVVGYLMGCPDSALALDYFRDRIKSYSVFSDLFSRFPAHLHINFSPDHRGKGLGKNLIREFIADLRKQKSLGVHIVTAPDARNVGFYTELGFNERISRRLRNSELLFMGMDLSAGHEKVELTPVL